MTSQNDNPMLTITLTGRRPVKVKKEDWGLLAESDDLEFDNQYEFQANRTSRWALKVRQHDDRRAIVYAVYTYRTAYLDERDITIRGGELLPNSDDLPTAIRRVGKWMAAQRHAGEDAGRWEGLISDCTADLPAEEL
jgi:hypothetical protein